MASRKTALRPDVFNSLSTFTKKLEAAKRGVTEEEQAYYTMSLTDGWKQFVELTESLVKELDQVNDNAVAQGMPYEELGKNTVVISLAKGVIRQLLNKVNDAKESCEKPDGTK